MSAAPRVREQWQAHPGEDALLLYFIFGDFPRELALPLSRYGSAGLPQGVQLYRHEHDALRGWAGYPLGGALGDILRGDSPQVVARAEQAGTVLSVRGMVADPETLAYLDDTMGVLAGLLDIGGEVIVDPQILSLHGADPWRARFAVRGGSAPRSHVLVLANEDEDGARWVHTRGLRKFGRPDLSVRGVPPAQAELAGALCERLVALLADGAWLEAGQVLVLDGVGSVQVEGLRGDRADPRFNNTHFALRWPEAA